MARTITAKYRKNPLWIEKGREPVAADACWLEPSNHDIDGRVDHSKKVANLNSHQIFH
jgi:hypothetical protein